MNEKIIKNVKVLLIKTFNVDLKHKVVTPYTLSKFNLPNKKEAFRSAKIQKELRLFSNKYHIFYSGKTVYGFLVEASWSEADKFLTKLGKLGVKNLLIGEPANGVILFEAM